MQDVAREGARDGTHCYHPASKRHQKPGRHSPRSPLWDFKIIIIIISIIVTDLHTLKASAKNRTKSGQRQENFLKLKLTITCVTCLLASCLRVAGKSQGELWVSPTRIWPFVLCMNACVWKTHDSHTPGQKACGEICTLHGRCEIYYVCIHICLWTWVPQHARELSQFSPSTTWSWGSISDHQAWREATSPLSHPASPPAFYRFCICVYEATCMCKFGWFFFLIALPTDGRASWVPSEYPSLSCTPSSAFYLWDRVLTTHLRLPPNSWQASSLLSTGITDMSYYDLVLILDFSLLVVVLFYFVFLKIGSYTVLHTGLELSVILLPHSPESWSYRREGTTFRFWFYPFLFLF